MKLRGLALFRLASPSIECISPPLSGDLLCDLLDDFRVNLIAREHSRHVEQGVVRNHFGRDEVR